MSPVFAGARLRRALALVAGLLVLLLPSVSHAADRSSKKASSKSASKPSLAAPASHKAALPARVSATPVRRQVSARAEARAVRGGAATRAASASPSAERALRASATPTSVRATRNGRLVRVAYAPRTIEPPRLSIGNAIGLHLTDDPLDLGSSVAIVVDQQTGQPLYEKNPEAVLPIASITKVMTAMVVLDAGLPMDEMLDIADADRDTERHSGSRLAVGARLSRGEMMQLALMASENRAAHALGRHFPGGAAAFVAAMNAKAQAIGMVDSRFADPTGLSSGNVSNARDLARMVRAAHGYPLVRQYSTASDLTVDTGYRQVTFRTTNRLVDDPSWSIGMQKTGYISEAGKCLVLQARIEGRPVIVVLLDASRASARFTDAQRLRRWIEDTPRPTRSIADARS